MESGCFVSVILDGGLDKPLDYSIPLDFQEKIKQGARVVVPVRGKPRYGTVFELKKSSTFSSVKPILTLFSEETLVSEELFKLAKWISKYYCAPLGNVIRLMLPPSVRRGMEEKRQLYIKPLLSRPQLLALCEKKRQQRSSQADVLEILLAHPKGILLSELLEKSKASRSPVLSLEKAKVIALHLLEIDRNPLLELDFFQTKPKKLNSEQKEALDKICLSLKENKFETHLLHGVTGSGKTEVYLQAIESCLSLQKSALFLVPEIALTSQTVERLKSRFENKIAILHHRLSEGERRDVWHKIYQGEIRLAVGARSAVFCPLKNLGLLIIDEEHDAAYKQNEEAPCYHARDVAIVRAKISSATVILGSATPSIESYQNALIGKYTLSTLRERATEAFLPTVKIINMLLENEKAKKNALFSDALLQEIKTRIEIGEQSLLFLNRRGFHTAQNCTACGHTVECPHCSISLTFHKGENSLACHLCNYELTPPPRICPQCQKSDTLKYKGAGTEQVERSLHAIFPAIRTLRLDADTTSYKGSHEKLFKQFRSGKGDVLIGTQMIAKGLHFPSVTLVGILNADAALQIPDFRATETTFQLLTQVAGRSGRGALPGLVLIQTKNTSHPTILQAASQNYLSFFKEEIESRKMFGYPPFSHLVKLIFSGPHLEKTEKYGQEIRSILIQKLPPSFLIHPLIPCGYAKVKNQFRFQCLIKGESSRPITEIVETLQKKSSQMRFYIDVDPLSTYF